MQDVLNELGKRRELRKEARERRHRDVVNTAARLLHVSRVAMARGMSKVTENQHALEAEAKRLKALSNAVLDQTVQWGGAYQGFRADVEGLSGVEDWAFQTEVAMRHLVETLASVQDALAAATDADS